MKSPALLLGLAAACGVTTLFAQGPLAPPAGAPAPTMKRLDATDPGTPLDPGSFGTTGVVIDRPGAYYLTGNVTTVPATEAAITVQATGVTIDLRGFALIAAGGTGVDAGDVAILVSSGQNAVTVRNGSIRGAWRAGVHATGRECSAEDVRVAGTIAFGLRLGDHAHVSRCRVDGLAATGSITSAGIFVEDDSQVRESTVTSCDGHGIQAATGALVIECIANENTLNGITVGDGSTVSRCASGRNTGKGIELAAGGTVSECTAYDNTGSGVTGATGGAVTATVAFSNGDRGISFTSAAIRNSIAARSTNAGIAVTKESSITHSVAGANSGDGFLADSIGNLDDVVLLEGCAAFENGQTATNVNADGFETDAAFKMIRCVAANNRGWGLRVAGNVSDSGTVDGNLFVTNTTGGITFSSNFAAPLIIRNAVGTGQISPAPSTTLYDLLAPFGTAQSDQAFVNF